MRKRCIYCVILSVLGLGVLCFFWYPSAELRVCLIKEFYSEKWSQYQALSKMLVIGMAPNEVIKILGKPSLVDRFPIGERWIYVEDEPISDWTCVVEFKREPAATNVLKLCYVLNMENRIFPDAPRWQMGVMLKLTQTGGTILLGDPTYMVQTTNVEAIPSHKKPLRSKSQPPQRN
jgi:outer membrane protein assembly factor BamE (lipoprotein component of BamABCDE complex)